MMDDFFRGYVPTRNKRSLCKFGHGEQLLTFEEANRHPEFAGVLRPGFVVFDCDNPQQSQLLLQVIRSENLNCWMQQTTKGVHVLLSAGGMAFKNFTRRLCALGISVDIRCDPNGYIVLKWNGERRRVLREMDHTLPLSTVPCWLRLIKGNDISFTGMREGSGRNSALFAHIARLTSNGFTKEETRQTLHLINRHLFAEALGDGEMATILREEAFENLRIQPIAEPTKEPLLSLDTIAKLRPEQSARYQWTDIGSGRLFADLFRSKSRYVPERKMWFCYDGARWAPDIGSLKTMELCKDWANTMVLYALKIEDERIRNGYLEYLRKFQLRRNREIILRDAQSVYPVSIGEFDKNPSLFNCANGTLCLDTLTHKPHSSDDLLTKISDVHYNPEATCTRWDEFVSEIMENDREVALFLQKSFGYALSGDTRYECLFILIGHSTRNGKSVACETVLRVLGNYGCSSQPESIGLRAYHNSAGPSEDVARLDGIRFVSISEPPKGLVLDVARVKTLTGNDSINARYLHENSFDFRPQFKIFINTNHLPAVNDMTLFASGRLHLIPFNRHFSEEEQDKTLKQKFAQPENQSAILNWLLTGYTLLCKEGLKPPGAVVAATETYRHDSDKIALFAEDTLIPEPNGEERTSAVYARYELWCAANGYHAENARNFNQMLSSIATTERKRPRRGGEKTTLLLGYRLAGEEGIQPL